MEFLLSNVYLPLEKEESDLPSVIVKMLKIDPKEFVGFKIIKKAVDSRNKRKIVFVYTLLVTLNYYHEKLFLNPNVRKNTLIETIEVPKTRKAPRPVVVGFGPCGMFAALILARAGLKPIIVERGKTIDERVKDVDEFVKNGTLNPKSNLCFGEGGAGTFSDGKLNTGLNDARIRFVLNEFIAHGAPEEIYYQNHPHIGSDNLVNIVKRFRKEIVALGGKFLFETTFLDFVEKDQVLTGVRIANKSGEIKEIACDDCLLAIGHSARDTFSNLYKHNLKMIPKDFSIGVRIEHLQEDLDKCQYGKEYKNPKLPRSDYKQVVHLSNGRSVYTFCMCPGGEVVLTPTEEHAIVTNGMSLYARANTNCNAALLVNIRVDDYFINSPLDGIYLQEWIENAAFSEEFPNKAPCQRVGDFLLDQNTIIYGKVRPSVKPGFYFRKISEILPEFITRSLKEAIPLIGKKLKIFKDPDGIIVGVETRSSSPVSIPRDENLQSSIANLYPCGEGSAHAGGIMSSALDGIHVAMKVVEKYRSEP